MKLAVTKYMIAFESSHLLADIHRIPLPAPVTVLLELLA